MADTKKTTKKSASARKTSGGTRKKTSAASGSTRKRTSGASGGTRKQTSAKTSARSGGGAARKPSQRKPEAPAALCNSMTAGFGLLLLAVLLALALCRMNGVLLDGLLWLFGGLLGGSVPLFIVALCLAGVFVLCDLQPLRLRVLCILTFPIFWGALAQCIGNDPMSVSFTTLIELWQRGTALSSGGALGGMLAVVLTFLLSETGAKILLVLVLLVYVFLVCNTTPARLYRWLVRIIDEDTEELREQDMTVTPARPKRRTKKKRGSLFAFLRDQRARRKAERLAAQQEEAEAEPEPPAAPPQPTAAERARSRQERRRRLADVLPDDPVDVPDAPPWDGDVPPWGDDVPPWQEPEPAPPAAPEQPLSDGEVQAQVHREIANAMETPVQEYRFPAVELLREAPRASSAGVRRELKESSERLVDTLASFGIEMQIVNIVRGPSVTRFEVQMERGTKFSRLTALSDDIALALGADSVRIAPIPDKLAVGIEVPNKHVQTVALRDVIGSPSFVQTPARLAVALGKDITGSEQIIDLANMPHLLIAGTTGSGKSVCINSILISLLYKSSPEDVRLIMIDPKMVELGNYNGIPHLLIPVVTDPKKASGALSWAVGEMERRYALFAAAGVRDLGGYNRLVRQQQASAQPEETAGRRQEPLPQIVIVIDELADLMMVAAKEVETSICRIAQKARAAGMHLVVATQRPSADVITGIMKSNIPSRIAFAVASQVESRIILDTTGAEKLIGRGDMLYSPIGMSKPVRIQGCFVSSEEIERVIAHVKSTGDVEYAQEVLDHIERQAEAEDAADGYRAEEDEDALLPQAITIVVESGQASVSMLQRRLKLGYARAARLVDQMEQRGIVGPFEGSKPRQVLLSKDDWMQIQLRQKL